MRKPKFFTKPIKTNYKFQQGESIEQKVRRVLENKEPITDGAPMIYTSRDEGIIPAYNIRTDRWDIAQEAMNKVNADKIAKSKTTGKKRETKPDEKKTTDNQQPTKNDGTLSNAQEGAAS